MEQTPEYIKKLEKMEEEAKNNVRNDVIAQEVLKKDWDDLYKMISDSKRLLEALSHRMRAPVFADEPISENDYLAVSRIKDSVSEAFDIYYESNGY